MMRIMHTERVLKNIVAVSDDEGDAGPRTPSTNFARARAIFDSDNEYDSGYDSDTYPRAPRTRSLKNGVNNDVDRSTARTLHLQARESNSRSAGIAPVLSRFDSVPKTSPPKRPPRLDLSRPLPPKPSLLKVNSMSQSQESPRSSKFVQDAHGKWVSAQSLEKAQNDAYPRRKPEMPKKRENIKTRVRRSLSRTLRNSLTRPSRGHNSSQKDVPPPPAKHSKKHAKQAKQAKQWPPPPPEAQPRTQPKVPPPVPSHVKRQIPRQRARVPSRSRPKPAQIAAEVQAPHIQHVQPVQEAQPIQLHMEHMEKTQKVQNIELVESADEIEYAPSYNYNYNYAPHHVPRQVPNYVPDYVPKHYVRNYNYVPRAPQLPQVSHERAWPGVPAEEDARVEEFGYEEDALEMNAKPRVPPPPARMRNSRAPPARPQLSSDRSRSPRERPGPPPRVGMHMRSGRARRGVAGEERAPPPVPTRPRRQSTISKMLAKAGIATGSRTLQALVETIELRHGRDSRTSRTSRNSRNSRTSRTSRSGAGGGGGGGAISPGTPGSGMLSSPETDGTLRLSESQNAFKEFIEQESINVQKEEKEKESEEKNKLADNRVKRNTNRNIAIFAVIAIAAVYGVAVYRILFVDKSYVIALGLWVFFTLLVTFPLKIFLYNFVVTTCSIDAIKYNSSFYSAIEPSNESRDKVALDHGAKYKKSSDGTEQTIDEKDEKNTDAADSKDNTTEEAKDGKEGTAAEEEEANEGVTKLPHITIQIPVYTEDLLQVVVPTCVDVIAAMQYYREKGGTCNLFINDDGLLSGKLKKSEYDKRLQYYALGNIGYISRPKENRAGIFKKASNMNYCVNIALKVQQRMELRRKQRLQKKGIQDMTLEELGSGANRAAPSESVDLDWYSTPSGDVAVNLPSTREMQDAMCELREEMNFEWIGGGDITLGDFILLLDADTRLGEKVLYQTVGEFSDPHVGFTQHHTRAMRQDDNYWEDAIASFTNNVYNLGIAQCCAYGDVSPLVGHNVMIRKEALNAVATREVGKREVKKTDIRIVGNVAAEEKQESPQRSESKEATQDYNIMKDEDEQKRKKSGIPEAGTRILWWSESHVSEDFEFVLRLMANGYYGRYVTYTTYQRDVDASGGFVGVPHKEFEIDGIESFMEGVSLTHFDEVIRLRKYAYGCCEVMFNKCYKWCYKGIFSKLFITFLRSDMPFASKFSILAYMGTYFAIGMAIPFTACSTVVWHLYDARQFVETPFDLFVQINLLFCVFVPFCGAFYFYRRNEKNQSLCRHLFDEFKHVFVMWFFWTSILYPVMTSILTYFLNLKISWGATRKTIDKDSNSIDEFKYVLRQNYSQFIFMILLFGGLFTFHYMLDIPWTVHDVPLLLQIFAHLVAPIALNPVVLRLKY